MNFLFLFGWYKLHLKGNEMHKTYWIFLPNIFHYFVYKECRSLMFPSEMCHLLIFYWVDMSLVFVRERSFSACPKVNWKFDSFYPKLGEASLHNAFRNKKYLSSSFYFDLVLLDRLAQRVWNSHVTPLITIPSGTICM